jgi:hypothetical protein
MNLYSHVMPLAPRDAAEAIDRVLVVRTRVGVTVAVSNAVSSLSTGLGAC